MWKEEILALKFPFSVKSEEDAENILFKNSSRRLIIIKWIYCLLHCIDTDISSNGLAEYLSNMGLVSFDPLKFVEGSLLVKHQKKVWKNLFALAKMIEISPSPEMSQLFTEKFQLEMPESSPLAGESYIGNELNEKHFPVGSDFSDIDEVIADVQQLVENPIDDFISEDNKKVLNRLKEYLEKFRPIQLKLKKLPQAEEVQEQKEFGNSIHDLYTTLKSLESMTSSSCIIVNCLEQLKKDLRDQKSRNEMLTNMIKDLEEEGV